MLRVIFILKILEGTFASYNLLLLVNKKTQRHAVNFL